MKGYRAPDKQSIDQGGKYCCEIDRGECGCNGKIYNEKGIIYANYGIREYAYRNTWGNPLNKPDFVVINADDGKELVIRRTSFVPSNFQIRKNEEVAGQIRMRNILRNAYTIQLDPANIWTFRMPLFTNRFWGKSECDEFIWVIVGSPGVIRWTILTSPGAASFPLLAAIAFIHNEWYNYS